MSKKISLTGDNTLTRIKMNPEEIGVHYLPNIEYEDYGQKLYLQILQPNVYTDPNRTFPCIIFVQGSHWGKQNMFMRVADLTKLAAKGYAIAITQYRDYDAGFHFPDPIIDAKNAVRFMKENATKYHVQKENFIMMGDSSGGQVATVAGMTAKTDLFDKPINSENAHVKGIIDLYGAVNLSMEGGFPTSAKEIGNHTLATPEGSEMGFDIMDHLEKTQAANSVTYINEDFGPMLIAHGTGDVIVSDKESIQLYEALKKANKLVHLYLIEGASHGNNAFYSQKMVDIYDEFIHECFAYDEKEN